MLLSCYGNRFVISISYSMINTDANVATRSDNCEILNFLIKIYLCLAVYNFYLCPIISYQVCIAFKL